MRIPATCLPLEIRLQTARAELEIGGQKKVVAALAHIGEKSQYYQINKSTRRPFACGITT
jgi:hypothetical protein